MVNETAPIEPGPVRSGDDHPHLPGSRLVERICLRALPPGGDDRGAFQYQIKFPKDFTTNCGATPDTLIYTSLGCDLLSVSVTDG